MRITILIITVLFSVACFGQGNSVKNKAEKTSAVEKVDTLNAPILSYNEMISIINSIGNKIDAMKELNLIQQREQDVFIKELQRIYAIIEKKRKEFK